MADINNSGYQKEIEFREIVLSHIRRILELSSHELRNATRTIMYSNTTQVEEAEDTRLSYVQAIENLSYVLMPYFDSAMQKVYAECIPILTGFDFDICKNLNQEYKRISAEIGKENIQKLFALEMKLRYSKKMFYELNLLLKRNDYLQQSVYGEGVGDEVVIDDEGEGGGEQ